MRRAGLLLAAAGALVLGVAPLAAQDSLEQAKRRELEEIQRQAQEKRAAASRLKGQENTELTRLRRTERDLGMTRRRLRSLQSRRRNLDQQLESTRTNLERSELTLQAQRARSSIEPRHAPDSAPSHQGLEQARCHPGTRSSARTTV